MKEVRDLKISSILSNDTYEGFEISVFSEADCLVWDQMVTKCPMATFLHTRRYLAYHADRFQDISLIIKDSKKQIIGLFPAALDPSNSRRVISHPGITYGGILHEGRLKGENMLIALESIMNYYADLGVLTLRYKLVPSIYHQIPSADDSYALFRLGATRHRCDLASVIDFNSCSQPSQRRQRGLKKALKAGVMVKFGVEFVEPLWLVLEENLKEKYGAKPVHTLDEIILLHSLFPKNIEFAIASHNDQVISGVVIFVLPKVSHCQYIASNSLGYKISALDLVLQSCIEKAKSENKQYFSFGISNEQEGQHLNTGLYQFKSEFGGGGVVHEFYEVDLKR